MGCHHPDHQLHYDASFFDAGGFKRQFEQQQNIVAMTARYFYFFSILLPIEFSCFLVFCSATNVPPP